MVGAASDVQIYPGAYNGGVAVYNLGTYPLYSSSFKAATTALTPAIIKALVPQQGNNLTLGSINYGLLTSATATALPGLVVTINGQQLLSIDGLIALLVANMQYIFTNLKSAGIAGFTTY